MHSATVLLLVAASVGFAASNPAKSVAYRGHKVLSITPKNPEELELLKGLEANEDLSLDFWTDPVAVGKEVGIRVSPGPQEFAVREALLNMEVVDAIDDVQEVIDYQDMSNFAASYSSRGSIIGRYARIDEIHDWIDMLVSKHNDLVEPFNGGKSYEGRPLKGIKVGKSAPGKPAIWFHAGIHAREWVGVASCVYIIDQLLTSQDPSVKALRENLVWYIIPVTNPDGYEYTHTNDRMWRKTVQPHSYWCKGADPNRNWDAAWGTTGISRNPCSDIYPGPNPWSEPETRSLSQTIMSLKDELKGFISFHSFSQLWLTPWAYTTKYPADHKELMDVANEATRRLMAVHNQRWKVGPPSHILYEASGGAYDWAKMKAGIKFAYTLECRPNTMRPGFMLPASGIIPSGEETWAGVKYVAEFLVKKYGQ